MGVAENRWTNEDLKTFFTSTHGQTPHEGCLLPLTRSYHSRKRNCRGGSPRSPRSPPEELLGWDKWFNICNLKNGPLWKGVVFWRPSFSRCCSNSGSTQCQSHWSLWIWLKTNLIFWTTWFWSYLCRYILYIYIYVCNYRILEILSSGNFLLVVLFWCGKETHQPDCCSF